MYEDQKPGGSSKMPRPYTYHYDGAIYDGPDQYVSLLMTSDGVLESEIYDGGIEDPSFDNDGPCDVIEDDIGTDAITSIKTNSEMVQNPTGAPEPRGFIQVTHTPKNKAETRVTVSQSVPELLVTLPSLEEPYIQPMAYEADLYDKWARMPRSDMGSRSPTRPITVTAKGWSISQAPTQPDPPFNQTPTKTSLQVTVPPNEECKSLDSIIEHYNYMFPSSTDNSAKQNSKVVEMKSSYKESKLPFEDSIENSLKITNISSPKSNLVVKMKAPTQATNISPGTNSPDFTGNPPGLNIKKPGVQLVPHVAATASIDGPPDVNQSDKFLKMTRFWSWRPKAAVKWQKGVKNVQPNQLDKLDKNVNILKREKTVLKVLPKKTALSTSGSSEAPSGSNDPKLRPLGASSNGRSNPLVHMTAADVHDNDNNNTRYRNLNLRGSGVSAFSETLQTLSKSDASTRIGFVRENSSLHRLPEHLSNIDYSLGKNNTTPRLANPVRRSTGARGLATPQPKFRARLNRLGDAKSDTDGELKSFRQRPNQRSAAGGSDSDVPRVQFMDLNELNTIFGHGARPVVANNKPKTQKDDIRTIGLGLSSKALDPKSVI